MVIVGTSLENSRNVEMRFPQLDFMIASHMPRGSQHNTDNRCRHGNDKRVAKIRQEVPLLKDLHIMLKGQGKEKLRRHFPDQQRWLKGIAHYHIDREDYRKHHKQAKQYFSAYNR